MRTLFRNVGLILLMTVRAQADVPPGAVGRFCFEGSLSAINAVSGDSIRMTGTNLAEDRFGNARFACYLNGTSGSYVNLGTSAILKPVHGTIALWFKVDNIVYSGRGYDVNPLILTKSHNGNDFYEAYSIALEFSNRKISTTSTLSSQHQVGLRSTQPISIAKWYHVALAWDNDFLYLYVNGAYEGRMAKNFRTRFLASDSVMVGNSANTKNYRFFNGTVDDIMIYNRVLSAAEVADLYNAPDPNAWHVVRRWIFISLMAAAVIALIAFLVSRQYRRELEREKRKNQIQKQMFDMEMQVIRAQMNPHFIFNAMNSVQQFILSGDNRNAHKYLGKFSRLLRKILDSNREEYITLENEIDMLTKYVEIESLRFDHTFDCEIVADADVASAGIRIPQMLIQPVVENAIWHGLLPKKSERRLSIRFSCSEKKLLTCTVDDNGVGRHARTPVNPLKGQSMALRFITQRLDLMKKESHPDCSIRIIDKKNDSGGSEGTRVIILIPIMNAQYA